MSDSYDKFLCWYWMFASLISLVVGLVEVFNGEYAKGLAMLSMSIACGRGLETAALTREVNALKAKVG